MELLTGPLFSLREFDWHNIMGSICMIKGGRGIIVDNMLRLLEGGLVGFSVRFDASSEYLVTIADTFHIFPDCGAHSCITLNLSPYPEK